jgi:TPR repeat protein
LQGGAGIDCGAIRMIGRLDLEKCVSTKLAFKAVLIWGLASLAILAGPSGGRAQENPPTASADSAESDAASKAFFAGDYAKAKQIWEKLATENDPAAMTNLGIMYEKGLGVKRDMKAAEAIYLRAANLGYAQGQFDLGNLYYNGDGIKQDYKQAGRWYMAAADSGHLRSQYYLAQMYENGQGVPEDRLNALKWYVKAADGGLPEAKYVVGRKLLTGEDIEEDHAKAIPYLLDAADAGVPHARAWLGLAYYHGWGTPKNLVEAYVWLELGLDHLPAGELQQKAYDALRDTESDMSQSQLAAAKRLVAKASAKQSQN